MRLFRHILRIVLNGSIHDIVQPKDYDFLFEGAVGFDQLSDYIYIFEQDEADELAQLYTDRLECLGFVRVEADAYDDTYFVKMGRGY